MSPDSILGLCFMFYVLGFRFLVFEVDMRPGSLSAHPIRHAAAPPLLAECTCAAVKCAECPD